MRFCFLGVWLRQDWICSLSDPKASDVVWEPLQRPFVHLKPINHQLWFRTRGRNVPRGWFLFVIRHKGNNPRVMGWLQSGSWGHRQGRPMHPMRLRFRVIYLNRSRQLTLTLKGVSEPLIIDRLWLLRLPRWDALRRIKKRLNSDDQCYLPKSLPIRWRSYNQLLNGQSGCSTRVSYSRWQQLVEAPIVSIIPEPTESCCRRFVIQKPSKISPINIGQWVVLLRPGVQLAPWAFAILHKILDGVTTQEAPALLFGDEDLISISGERHSPRFKPAWNVELFWADPKFSNHWIVESQTWNHFLKTQSIDLNSWWSLQYGLLQYIYDHTLCARIKHLPIVLSHSRKAAPSGALSALQLQFDQSLGNAAPIIHAIESGLRLQWACPSQTLMTVMIPTRDHLSLLKSCLHSIEVFPAGCDLEIIVIDNGSVDASTLAFLDEFREHHCHQVIRDVGPFNYSRLNNRAALLAHGSVLLLLNNDVEFLSPNWGRELAANALRPGIGCVGAQLRYPDGSIQHGGVILGIGGIASHAHRDFSSESSGYQGRLQLSQELSAVTAACLAISYENWQQLDGLNANHLSVNYNDVDLCLRAQATGLRNLYLPQVKAIHHESKSRGRPEGAAYRQWRQEWKFMERCWGSLLRNDPAYHPCLTLEDERWGLSLRQPSFVLR